MSTVRSHHRGRIYRSFRSLARLLFNSIPITRCREIGGPLRLFRGTLRTAMLIPFLGYVRDPYDDQIADGIVSSRTWLVETLTNVMVPWLAEWTVAVLSFALVAIALWFATAFLVMRLPSFLGAILVWLIGEQQGNWFTSRAQLVVVISLPFALATALFCRYILGVYTLIYFAAGVTYIDVAIEPRRVNMLLQRYGLAQGVLSRSFQTVHDADEMEQEGDGEEG